SHTVRVVATDQAGNDSNPIERSFTLDTTPPVVTFDLDPSTDSPPVGDRQTTFSTVNLIGQTEPNLPVKLVETCVVATADSTGRFQLDGVSLPVVGANTFHVQATDPAGNVGEATNSFTFVQSTPACAFNDLTGWTIDEQGGTSTAKGTASVEGDRVVLREGDSFHVALDRTFVVPAGATSLSFSYADLSFDTSDANSIKDAFEASLLDSSGQSL